MGMRGIARVFALVAACLAWGEAADGAVKLKLKGVVERYGLEEISFLIPVRVANPYDPDDVSVMGEFRAPSGRLLRLPAFYYEEADAFRNTPGEVREWRLRFSPEEVGEYRVKVTFSRRRRKAELIAEGRFICKESKRAGFIGRSGRYFTVGTGGRFVPLGANRCWGNVLDTEAYLKDMDALAKSGANVIRVWLAPWWMPVEKERGRYDAVACARLDEVVRRAERLGLRVILCIEQHGNLEPEGREVGLWPEHPYNAKNGGPCRDVMHFFTSFEAGRLFRNRLRYLVARYGYSTAIMAWELFNEVEWIPMEYGGFGRNRWLIEKWHRKMSVYLRETDPFGHLIGTSGDARLQLNLLKTKAIDFVQLHVYDDRIGEKIADEVAFVRGQAAAPVVVGEFGWRTKKKGSGYVTEGIFATFFAGGGGALPWLQDEEDVAPCYERLRAAARFFDAVSPAKGFEPIPWKDLVFARQLEGGGWSMGEASSLHFMGLRGKDEAAFFIHGPGAAEVDREKAKRGVLVTGLRPGAHVIEYWSPSAGKVVKERRVMVKSESLMLEVPAFEGELAVRVRRVGD